jgi:hypothetical protein
MRGLLSSIHPRTGLNNLRIKIKEELRTRIQYYDGSGFITEDVLSTLWTVETVERPSLFSMLMHELRVQDTDSVAKFRQSLKLLSTFAWIESFPKTLAGFPYTDKNFPLSKDDLSKYFKDRSFNPDFVQNQAIFMPIILEKISNEKIYNPIKEGYSLPFMNVKTITATDNATISTVWIPNACLGPTITSQQTTQKKVC